MRQSEPINEVKEVISDISGSESQKKINFGSDLSNQLFCSASAIVFKSGGSSNDSSLMSIFRRISSQRSSLNESSLEEIKSEFIKLLESNEANVPIVGPKVASSGSGVKRSVQTEVLTCLADFCKGKLHEVRDKNVALQDKLTQAQKQIETLHRDNVELQELIFKQPAMHDEDLRTAST